MRGFSRPGGDGDAVEARLSVVEERLARLEALFIDLHRNVHETRAIVEELKAEIADLRAEVRRRNGIMRWNVVLLGMILSFLAAVLGVRWWAWPGPG